MDEITKVTFAVAIGYLVLAMFIFVMIFVVILFVNNRIEKREAEYERHQAARWALADRLKREEEES